MQVTETVSAGLKREFKVVVNAAELDKRLNDRLAEMAARANIKGFRPGKVPVPHLRRVYGKSAMAEVVQKAIDDESKAILAERNLKPAYQPEVTLPETEAEVNAIMEGKSDLAFSMAFEVIPNFDLVDHAGIELVRHLVEVSEDHVAESLKRLTAQAKSFTDKEGAAGKGDRLTIDFVGKIDGVAFEGGTANEVPIEIGAGQFIPGFEDQLVGAKAGEERGGGDAADAGNRHQALRLGAKPGQALDLALGQRIVDRVLGDRAVLLLAHWVRHQKAFGRWRISARNRSVSARSWRSAVCRLVCRS